MKALNTIRSIQNDPMAKLLSKMWVFLSLNYILCDLLSNMERSVLRMLLEGNVGGVAMTEEMLLFAGVSLEIPFLMVLLSTILPYKANRITNISLATRYASRGTSNKQRNFLAVRSREKFIYMDLGHRRGIFRVTGSKKTPKINMVQDLTRSSTPIPKNPTIGPGFEEALTRLPAYYADALRFQLDRLGLS